MRQVDKKHYECNDYYLFSASGTEGMLTCIKCGKTISVNDLLVKEEKKST